VKRRLALINSDAVMIDDDYAAKKEVSAKPLNVELVKKPAIN